MLTTFKSIGSLEKACKGVSMNLFQHCSMSAVETHNLVVKGHDNIRNLKYINLYDPGLQKTIVGEVQYSSISNADQTTIQFKTNAKTKDSPVVADWFREQCTGGHAASAMSSESFSEWPQSLLFACSGSLSFSTEHKDFFRNNIVIGMGKHPQTLNSVWWIGAGKDSMSHFVDNYNPGRLWLCFACNSTPTPFGNIGFKFNTNHANEVHVTVHYM